MNTTPITTANPLTVPGARSVRPGIIPGNSPFAQWLGSHSPPPGHTNQSNADQVREAARSLVAISFIQPLLTEARQDPFRSEMFHGGFAEDAFGAQLDSIIAEQITKRADLPLVESVYRQIAGNVPTQSGTRVNTHG